MTHYLKCYGCGWKSEIGANDADCPKCHGFLCKKKTRHKSSPKYSKAKTVGSPIDESGYRLKKKGNGWVFIEGKKSSQVLSRGDSKNINACARRRGLVKSSNIYMKPQYSWT